ncbi:hypothetical protein HPP92_002500 [Vanilla planifolia]|uniref:Uncharacterized protein n=1 Tax=Vanilla planifolia TaxID=51239 RepID=A0A835SET7_VANPL|nr:hypothetical protein HPP92_002500 [Vanilla planifolia]
MTSSSIASYSHLLSEIVLEELFVRWVESKPGGTKAARFHVSFLGLLKEIMKRKKLGFGEMQGKRERDGPCKMDQNPSTSFLRALPFLYFGFGF